MAPATPTKLSPTDQHLLVEYTSTESTAGMVLPVVKLASLSVANVQHLQIMRYVYTLVRIDDIYFEGRRLDRMPGLREYVAEAIKPGQQIVSRPSGKYGLMLAYSGKKNVFAGAVGGEKLSDELSFPFVDYMGDDPAPRHLLYGNPRIPFVQWGDLPPIAAAYYNSRTGRFLPVESPRRAHLLGDFQRRFSREPVTG